MLNDEEFKIRITHREEPGQYTWLALPTKEQRRGTGQGGKQRVQPVPPCQRAGSQGDGGGYQGVDWARPLLEGFPHAAGARARKAHGDEDLAAGQQPGQRARREQKLP